jgi:hypothetical protein
MQDVEYIFQQCRTTLVTIVFGNLGRHPQLLTYYLNFCFPNELLRIESKLDTQKKSPCDVCILVEPYFGATIIKPSDAKHLIVMTSHLILNWSDDCRLTTLFTGSTNKCIRFVSIDYNKNFDLHKVGATIHEIYLQILTAFDFSRDGSVEIEKNLSSRHVEILKIHMIATRSTLIKLKLHEPWMDRCLFFQDKFETFFRDTK